ncbi:unnamed protein product [Urochloa humidicola]
MSSPRKQCRASTAAPAPAATTTPAAVLPSDLVLEIAARSDAATLVRCAACHTAVPSSGAPATPRARDSSLPASFSLAHPATPAAARLPSLARYDPVTSRGGLAVLLRHASDAATTAQVTVEARQDDPAFQLVGERGAEDDPMILIADLGQKI